MFVCPHLTATGRVHVPPAPAPTQEDVAYRVLVGSLRATVQRFRERTGRGSRHGAVVAAGLYGRQLAELNKAARVGIVAPVFEARLLSPLCWAARSNLLSSGSFSYLFAAAGLAQKYGASAAVDTLPECSSQNTGDLALAEVGSLAQVRV